MTRTASRGQNRARERSRDADRDHRHRQSPGSPGAVPVAGPETHQDWHKIDEEVDGVNGRVDQLINGCDSHWNGTDGLVQSFTALDDKVNDLFNGASTQFDALRVKFESLVEFVHQAQAQNIPVPGSVPVSPQRHNIGTPHDQQDPYRTVLPEDSFDKVEPAQPTAPQFGQFPAQNFQTQQAPPAHTAQA